MEYPIQHHLAGAIIQPLDRGRFRPDTNFAFEGDSLAYPDQRRKSEPTADSESLPTADDHMSPYLVGRTRDGEPSAPETVEDRLELGYTPLDGGLTAAAAVGC